MASSNFTIAPSTGTGNGTITVTPRSTNTGHSDKKARVTITNAGRTAQADIIQYGIPSITLIAGNTNVPSTGGTLAYSIYSRYPFGFSNKPEWVTVYDSNGNYYGSNTEISPSLAGRTFYIEIDNWEREMERRTDDYLFAFRFKKRSGGSWDSHSTLFGIVQQGAVTPDPDYLNVSPLFLVFDFDSTSNKEATVNASSTAWTITNTSGNFTATKSNGKVLIRPLSTNAGSTKLSGSITIGLNSLSQTISVSQYSHPRIALNGGYDTGVPMEGGNKYVQVTSDYEWWFLPLPIPDYISIYDGLGQEVHLSSYFPYDPSSTGVRQPIFTFTWDENTTDGPRVDSFYLGIIDTEGNVRTFGRDIIRFTQRNSPTRIHIVSGPDRLRVSNIAGVKSRLTVLAFNCSWMFSDIPNYITSIKDEDGNTISGWQSGTGVEETFYATWDGLPSTGDPRSYHPMILWKYTEGDDEVTGRDYAATEYTQYPYVMEPSFFSPSNYTIPYYGSQISFTINSDYEWYWSGVPAYVTAILDEDGNNAYYTSSNKCTDTGITHYYTWAVDANAGNSARTFRSKIAYYNGQETVVLDSGTNFRQGFDGEIYPNTVGVPAEMGLCDTLVSFDAVPWSYSIDNAGSQFLTVRQAETDQQYSKFIVRYDANTASTQRTAVITFTNNNGTSKTFEIHQLGSAVYTATPNPVEAAAVGTTYNIALVMSYPWTYTVNDRWITVTGATGSPGSSTIGIRTTTNSDSEPRIGSVSLKVDNIEVCKINVVQEGATSSYISVAPTVFYVPAESEKTTYHISVDADYNWTAAASDPYRVMVLDSTGSTSRTSSSFYVKNNPYNTTEQEYIQFACNGGSSTVLINQYGPNQEYPVTVKSIGYLSYASSSGLTQGDIIYAPSASSPYTYYINTDATMPYVAKTYVDWITIGSIGEFRWGLATSLYIYTNNTGKNRTGYITLTAANGVGRMVTINQKG